MEDARFGVTLDFEKLERFVEAIKPPFRKALNTGRIDLKRPLETGPAEDMLRRASKSNRAVLHEGTLVVPLGGAGRVLGLLVISGVRPGQLPVEAHPFLSALADQALDVVRLRLALETDPLTGLANEYALDEALMGACSRFMVGGHRLAARDGQDDLALLYLQPLGGATMLERYGRRFTHSLLKDIAKRLKEAAGPCLCLAREDTRLVLLLSTSQDGVRELAKTIRETIASVSLAGPGEAFAIAWHMGAALARLSLSGLPPAEEAALLRMRASRALNRAVSVNWPEVLMFDEIVPLAGRVREVLSFNRVLLDVGALHGLSEDTRFVVFDEREDKAEIQVVSLGEEDALAEVTNLFNPTMMVKAGHRLRLLKQDKTASSPSENTVRLGGREFLASLDESSGLISHHSLVNIFNQLAANEEANLNAALIRVDGLENMRQVVGRLGVNRLFKTLADRAKAFCERREGAVIGRFAPDTMALLMPELDKDEACAFSQQLVERLSPHSERPLRAGVGYHPCVGFAAREVLQNAAKALAHAAFLEPGAVVPLDAVSLNISADNLFDQGRLAEAAAEYERALLLCDQEVNVLNSLGVCYGQLGDMEKAFAMFARAQAAAPRDYMAYYNQGYTLMGQKKWQEARAKFALCLELQPDHAGALFQLGRVAQEMGELVLALDYYRHTEQNPSCPGGLYRYLGEALTLVDNRLEAEEAFKKAIKYNSADAVSLGQLAGLYLGRAANLEIALSLAKRAVDLSPSARHWQIYAQAFMALKRPREGLAALQKALSQHPGEPSLLLEMAKLQAALGLGEAARASLQNVLKGEPNLKEALDLMNELKE